MDEKLEYTAKFLDTIPLWRYIHTGYDVYEIMEDIEADWNDKVKDNSVFEGHVFNWMDPEEFGMYLADKGYKIVESTMIRYIVV